MPFEPLRFIHAAGVSLDRPLALAARPPDTVRKTVEDATLTAFAALVDACIDRHADFLLLVGDTFRESDKSLRARIALENGLARLAEHDIRVFVLPGRHDPPPAWQAIPRLPDNVTAFFSRTGEPVAVIRDGKVIASVAAGWEDFGEEPAEQAPLRRRPFRVILFETDEPAEPAARGTGWTCPRMAAVPASVRVAGVDYVACGAAGVRQSLPLGHGLVHHPGRTQGLRSAETGPRGCTLVSVDVEGSVQTTFLPTAPVRWEVHSVELHRESTPADVAAQMQAAVNALRPEPCERVWLVRWQLRGFGPLLQELRDPRAQRALIDSAPVHGNVHIEHLFEHAPELDPSSEDQLSREFHRLWQELRPVDRRAVEDALTRSGADGTEWGPRLQSLLPDVDPEAVSQHARRCGLMWLG